MSDIYCKCGEPWDLDCLHDFISENYDESTYRQDDGRVDQAKYDPIFREVRAKFRKEGCEMFGTSHSDISPQAGELMALADDIMGDDVDGIISMMEDARAIGLF